MPETQKKAGSIKLPAFFSNRSVRDLPLDTRGYEFTFYFRLGLTQYR